MTADRGAGAPLRDPAVKRGPVRILGRKRMMTCAFCGRTKRWTEDFPSRIYAECWTCWLLGHPRAVEPIQRALAELPKEPVL